MKENLRQRLSLLPKPLVNQKGQMAIFVALIFQVLFVLFAMSINVALVVHDKINLQNSVDLAAYYAAQRQAEHLNVIAHINYQIRQSWKLLTWRYRVMGSLGLNTPAHPQTEGFNPEERGFLNDSLPTFCVSHSKSWVGVPSNQNLCKSQIQEVPPLTVPGVIAGFNPINQIIRRTTEQLKSQASRGCDGAVAQNYWLGATIMKSFREDQANRKELILALANNLQRSGEEIVDLDGSSILAGVRKVILKNLTHGNRDISDPNIEIFNSLEGIPTRNWLSEIVISPAIYYSGARSGEGCNVSAQSYLGVEGGLAKLPERETAHENLQDLAGGGPALRELRAYASDARLEGNPLYDYSLGFEKNPWNMVYVGVKAEAQARQLFFPLGRSIRLRARAYAKPFGGRIGPWYYNLWASGDNASSGEREQQTDALTPVRQDENDFRGDPNDRTRFPNYSRFPGDRLGLDSQVAQAEVRGLISEETMNIEHYKAVAQPIRAGQVNRVLAWDYENNRRAPNTERELAAIAPDLFDITYYSIEPKFNQYYLVKLLNNEVRGALGIPAELVIRGDLGANSPPANDGPQENIHQTILRAGPEGGNRTYHEKVNYKVNDRRHLLTSWIPDEVTNFLYTGENLPQHFGQCGVFDDDQQGNYSRRVPGSCLMNGGRTGYSVKIVSRDSLINGQFTFSPDSPAGEILNKPPEGDGW